MAYRFLTSRGPAGAQSAFGRDVRPRRLLRRHRSLSALKSHDGGVSAADSTAGIFGGGRGKGEARGAGSG